MQLKKKYKALFDRKQKKWCEIKGKDLKYTEVPVLNLYEIPLVYAKLSPQMKNYISLHCEVKYLEMSIVTSTPPTVWKTLHLYTKEQLDLVKYRISEGENWRTIHRKYFIERSPRGIKELVMRIQKKQKNGSN